MDFNENLKNLSIENLEDTTKISLIGRALSSPIRIEIMRALNKKPMLLSQIAEEFDLPISSAAFHMRVLEEGGLVTYEFSTKRKGTLKWYSYAASRRLEIALRADNLKQEKPSSFIYSINIGDYIDAEFTKNCGIATEKEHIMEDNPKQAFINERKDAQLIWMKPYGFLSYLLPNDYSDKGELSEINFSLEICSEAMGYNNEYPSDITFWVNDVELCTYTCPGDFGDRYGKFTPPWWFKESTKYGLLTNVSVKEKGVFLNEKLVNKKIGIKDLHLTQSNRTTFKLGVKKDAAHLGGFNIFGEKFGDYNQAIIFTARYK